MKWNYFTAQNAATIWKVAMGQWSIAIAGGNKNVR